MATLRVETKLDQFARDVKMWSKGFIGGSIFTLGTITYVSMKHKAKEMKKKTEELRWEKDEES